MPHTTGPERALLEEMLDDNREELIACVQGLSETDARSRLVPSLTSPLSLLRHVAAVERSWFQRVLGGLPDAERDGYARGDEPSWTVTEQDTVAGAVADLRQAIRRSKEIAARHDLDHEAEHQRMGTVSLRWIYLHMIEEVARHAGHADILREQLDGRKATDGWTCWCWAGPPSWGGRSSTTWSPAVTPRRCSPGG